MVEPAAEDEVDRLLRSGLDVLPVSYNSPLSSRKMKTRKQGPKSSSPRSPAFRQLGRSIASTDKDVVHRVRDDIGQLRNRTQTIQKAFESARLRRKRASKKVNAGVRVSRNRMDPRYLRDWRLVTRKAVRVLQPWWRSKMNSRSIMIRRIQKTIRGYLQYSKYTKGRWSVICIQSYVRMQYRRRKYKIKLRKHREAIARKRALLADRRRERKNRFLFREARKICGNLYIVSVQRCPHETVLLEAYSPARQVVFAFRVKKSSIRITSRERLLRDAAKGKLNSKQDVVDDHEMYSRLADRLTERKVNGEVSLKLKVKGALGERGKRLLCRGVKLDDRVHVVSVYLYVGSYVFDAYCPSNQSVIRLRFSSHHLRTWLNWNPAESTRPRLLRPENHDELLHWLCDQLMIKYDPLLGRKRLLLEMQLREDVKATVIQCMVRKHLARAKSRAQCHKVVRKIFDADQGAFFYFYTRTGLKLWHKPHVLTTDDIQVPEDWEETQNEDGITVYFHPKTGRYSRISPSVAAAIVQKRFRDSRSKDYRMELPLLVKALKMVKRAEEEYKNRPDHLPAIVNYAMYLHCLKFDYLHARRVYERARKIAARNPVILYGYSLLLLAGNFYPRKKYWMLAQDYIALARNMDKKGNAFHVAEENFFHWGLVANPKDERALCNYALMHQYVNQNINAATKYFLRAINVAPSNETILKCYNEMLDPDSVITESERVLWKSRNTKDYLFQAYETRNHQSEELERNKKELEQHLKRMGVDRWTHDLQQELGVTSLSKLKNITEKDLIHVGVRPKHLRVELLKSVGVDVESESPDRGAHRRPIESDNEAATIIQNLFRRSQARVRIFQLISSVVYKCWDENSQCFYYYNEKTGESKWTKPALLGNHDLDACTEY